MRRRIATVVFALVLATWYSNGGAPPAAAQKPAPPAVLTPYPGGVEVVTDVFDPSHPTSSKLNVVYSNPTLLADTVNQVWTRALPTLKGLVEQNFNGYQPTGNADPHLYNVSCTPAQKCTVKAGTPGGRDDASLLAVQLVLQGNSVSFKSTLPPRNLVDLGGDPSYQVTFDLTVTVWIEFPGSLKGQISAQNSVTLNVSNVKAQPTNDKAKILDFLANLFNENIIGKIQSGITAANPGKVNLPNDLSASLTSVLTNTQLAPLAKAGSQVGLLWDFGTNAKLTALGAPSAPTQTGPYLLACACVSLPISSNRPGWISGLIHWSQSLGQPASPGTAFKIQVFAQSGGPVLGHPAPPALSVGVVQPFQLAGPGPNGESGMSYVVEQLPLDVPLRVAVTDGAGNKWSGQSVTAHVFQDDGWNGNITIQPGSSAAYKAQVTGWPKAVQLNTPVQNPGSSPSKPPAPGPKTPPKTFVPPLPQAGSNPTGAGGVPNIDFLMG